MTTLDTRIPAGALSRPKQRTPLALGLGRGVLELKMFFREKDTVAFTFLLPIVIVTIIASIFSGPIEGTAVTVPQLFIGGMVAGGIASTSFVTLGSGIASDREDGTIKRLIGTPMPRVSYFIGKVLLVLVTSAAEACLVLLVGVIAFGLSLPTDVGRWFEFGWIFLLGVTSCSMLGVAVSSLARSTRAASALSNLALIVLSFASGVYILPITELPQPLIGIGSLFPIKWMAQGMRSVFMPDQLAASEMAGTWEHGRIALVLGAWCIGGLILCLTTFRWRGPQES